MLACPTLVLTRAAPTQENTRLQSKVLRFDMGVTLPPQPSQAPPGEARALMDELKEENLQLRDDNDKLVEYLEKLEARLGSGPPTPSAQDGAPCSARASCGLLVLGGARLLGVAAAPGAVLSGGRSWRGVPVPKAAGQEQLARHGPAHPRVPGWRGRSAGAQRGYGIH